jgi:hypothetical protein
MDMPSCQARGLFFAMRKIFVDSLSDPSFNAVSEFKKIKNLSEQKALLDDLKRGKQTGVIKKIVEASTIIAYEWIRDRIEIIPNDDFMPFFMQHFTDFSSKDISGVLGERHLKKESLEKFQVTIKKEEFVGSPVRSLLEREGIIDGNGDLIEYLASENITIKIKRCLMTQLSFIKKNGDLPLPSAFPAEPTWFEFLTLTNADMKRALENDISLECSIEVVEGSIHAATQGLPGNSIFSDYLKGLGLETIKGLSPLKHYALYLVWVGKLRIDFERKMDSIRGTELGIIAAQSLQDLALGVRKQRWEDVNTNARTILLIESASELPKDDLSRLMYQGSAKEQNLPVGFVQKVLEIGTGKTLLEKAEAEIDSIAEVDQAKWRRNIESEIQKEIHGLKALWLKPFIDEVNNAEMSIIEKKLKVEFLIQALAKVLKQELERLGMSPSYNDLIERAFYGSDGFIWEFLFQTVAYANYHNQLQRQEAKDETVQLLKRFENSLENEPLRVKVVKTTDFLHKLSEEISVRQELYESISPRRLSELVRVELENTKRRSMYEPG